MSGVKVETIRCYERTGAAARPVRTDSGRRIYDDSAVAGLRFIKRCRTPGFSIRDISRGVRFAV